MEIWKPIKDFEGLYEVSNYGRVKSLSRTIHRKNGTLLGVKEKILSSWKCCEYPVVSLWKENSSKPFYIHRLVAQAFIPNPNNYNEVNHKDEVKSNNRVDNLEWCTHHYNSTYGTTIERNSLHTKKKPVTQYDLRGNLIANFPSALAAAKINNISQGQVSNCCRGLTKTAGGYIFRYE